MIGMVGGAAGAQDSKDQAKKIAGHSSTGSISDEKASSKAREGFDTRPTTPPEVKASSGTTRSVDQQVREGNAQEKSTQKDTARKHSATGKPVPAPEKKK